MTTDWWALDGVWGPLPQITQERRLDPTMKRYYTNPQQDLVVYVETLQDRASLFFYRWPDAQRITRDEAIALVVDRDTYIRPAEYWNVPDDVLEGWPPDFFKGGIKRRTFCRKRLDSRGKK